MMSLWDALRMNMMISYQELVRTFPKRSDKQAAVAALRLLAELSCSVNPNTFFDEPG
ncbi:hypothetical protein ESCOMM063B_26700 [Escherichia coli]